MPDIADLEGEFFNENDEKFSAGLFGRGWLPPEERGKLVIEPEAEEEANGWEVVAIGTSRRSSSFSDTGAHSDKVRCDGVPDDLIMGCLDPNCDKLWSPGESRQRCSACGFFFCKAHIKGPWYVTCFGGSSSGASLLDSLNLPKPGLEAQVFLCFRCHNRLPLGDQLQGHELLLLSAEVCAMKSSVLDSDATEEESAVKTSARALLLRLLDQLRRCLRSWTDSEREWVWSLASELVERDVGWLAQFFRQSQWTKEESVTAVELLAKVHADLPGFESLQILGCLGRSAEAACAHLGERRLGLAAVHATKALQAMNPREISCCLELLLDAAHEFAANGVTGGYLAVLAVLQSLSQEKSLDGQALRNEFFWALETRVQTVAMNRQKETAASKNYRYAETWQSKALQELLKNLPQEGELDLMRQHAWVRHMEHGDYDCCTFEPAWGDTRTFPLAVWPAYRRCTGLHSLQKAESKSAPLIAKCRYKDDSSLPGAPAKKSQAKAGSHANHRHGERPNTSGVLLKKDPDMHKEQQVGQVLRLLEILIWKDSELQDLLQREGLDPEDVRATYTIVMTGPGTAMLEFIDGARTLREVRSGPDTSLVSSRLFFSKGEKGTLNTFLRRNNKGEDLPKSLKRLAFTAAISAVLSFVAGLGDRHHENFMVTVDGRLVHVDFGWALGKEPLDAMLIHFAVQGGRPATTIQYDELMDAVGHDMMDRIFWPVVCKAYLCVRRYPGLLAEMFYTAMLRERGAACGAAAGPAPRGPRAWRDAQSFVARNCAAAMPEESAQRFIHSLLQHCTRMERAAHVRDELKGLRLGEKTTEAVSKAWNYAKNTTRSAGSGTRSAAGRAAEVIKTGGPSLQQVRSAATSAFGEIMQLASPSKLSIETLGSFRDESR